MPGNDVSRRVAKPAGWGGEADGCGNPGRGFNLFKALRPILRASRERPIARARCVRPAARKRGDGEEGLPRRPEISGRGINLFKDFRPILRALVACRSGGPNLSALTPRSDASRRVSKPAAWGGGADGCGNSGRGFNLFKALRQVLRASRERPIAQARCVHPATPKGDGWEERLPRRPDISGRGFNLFKALRRIFRALVACRSGGPNLSALMPRSDARRRVAKRARAGSGADVCGYPGRGINLFKDFRPIFRALVACRSGGPNLSALMPRSDARRRVAKRARAGSGADVRGNPARGINLFRDFRPIFRALVACRSGGPNLSALMPRSDATRRVAKRARAGSGVDVCGNPGRGINLFKDFRPIFRALVACRSGGPNLSALVPRRDATRRVAKRARAGSGVDVCGNPGRGINLFKGFRPILRALLACRSGRWNLSLMPRSDATRRVAKRAGAGSGVDVCGNPGRGINLFNGFRPIFRALVACRSGGPNLSALMPRSDAARRVPKPAP